MRKVLEEKKAGDTYKIKVESGARKIKVNISTGGVTSNYIFSFNEWNDFVEIINKADEKMMKLLKIISKS